MHAHAGPAICGARAGKVAYWALHFGAADREVLERVKVLVVFGRLYLLFYFLVPVKVENTSDDKTSA